MSGYVNTYLSKNDRNALKITHVELSFTEHVPKAECNYTITFNASAQNVEHATLT